MSEGCHSHADPLSFKIPFFIFIEHKFPFPEGCDKVRKAPWSLFGEGRTPQQAYHLILEPTELGIFHFNLWKDNVCTLAVEYRINEYVSNWLSCDQRGKKRGFILRWKMQIKEKQMRLSNETRFQKRWLGKESKLVIHIIKTLAAAAKDNILSAWAVT